MSSPVSYLRSGRFAFLADKFAFRVGWVATLRRCASVEIFLACSTVGATEFSHWLR